PVTVAMTPSSLTSSRYSAKPSKAIRMTPAITMDAAAAMTPRAVSFLASDRFWNHCLTMGIIGLILDHPCEVEQLRAEANPRAVGRRSIDGEAHALVLDKKLG